MLATKKQVQYAREIAFRLGIKADPYSMTKAEAAAYIRANLPAYKKKMQEIKSRESDARFKRDMDEWFERGRKKTYYANGEYSGSYGTEIVDCFDYGICPWGDS